MKKSLSTAKKMSPPQVQPSLPVDVCVICEARPGDKDFKGKPICDRCLDAIRELPVAKAH